MKKIGMLCLGLAMVSTMIAGGAAVAHSATTDNNTVRSAVKHQMVTQHSSKDAQDSWRSRGEGGWENTNVPRDRPMTNGA